MLRNTEQAWGAVAKLLHWSMLLLILVQITLGWSAVNWVLSPMKINLFVWHKSVGMLILLLMILRLAWRLANPTPVLPESMPAWERRAARASHVLLYALLLAMPMVGWVVNSAANIPLRIFWLVPLPDIVAPSETVAEAAKRVHFGLYILLSVTLLAHVTAALRHHFVCRTNVLARMLPGSRL